MQQENHVEQTGRDSFIDFAKGISILLVLWGHCIQYMSAGCLDFFEDTAFKVIYSFHMPLFMLLSGYVSYLGHNKKLKTIILKRIRGIGIPLLMWGTIDFLIIAFSNTSAFNIRTWINSVIGIWFLWAVLYASILVAIIQKLPIKRVLKYFIMMLGTFLFIKMPGGIYTSFVYPYFIIGYAMNEFNIFENILYRKVIQPIGLIVWILLLPFWKRDYYIYISGLSWKIKEIGLLGQIGIDAFRYAIGFVGCIAVVGLLRILYDVATQRRYMQSKSIAKGLDIIERLGMHTLEIYVMQRVVLERCFAKAYLYAVRLTGQNILALNYVLFDLVFTLLCALVISIILLWISEEISKSRSISLFLFGKRIK